MNNQTSKSYRITGIILLIISIWISLKIISGLVLYWLASQQLLGSTSEYILRLVSEAVGSGGYGYFVLSIEVLVTLTLSIWGFIVAISLIKRKYTPKLLYLAYIWIIFSIIRFLIYIPLGTWRIINLIIALFIYMATRENQPFGRFIRGKDLNVKKK